MKTKWSLPCITRINHLVTVVTIHNQPISVVTIHDQLIVDVIIHNQLNTDVAIPITTHYVSLLATFSKPIIIHSYYYIILITLLFYKIRCSYPIIFYQDKI